MKLLTLLASTAALFLPTLSLEIDEAARLLYYYTVYDIDVTVNGQGKGYIAPDCKGSAISDGRCTLDEFVNWIFTDKASQTPEYYELGETPFALQAQDVAVIVEALGLIKEKLEEEEEEDKVVKGRRTAIGLFTDIGTIIDKDHGRATSLKMDISRHWANMQEALAGVRDAQKILLQGGLAKALSSMKDVAIQLVNRESDYLETLYTRVDWDKTIEKNPALLDPSSDLYKNAVKAMQDYNELEEVKKQKTIAYKATNLFNACF